MSRSLYSPGAGPGAAATCRTLCVIGIAREISAATGNPLQLPKFQLPSSEVRVQDLVAVRIEDPELCPRYVARVVRGVKIGPSPDWLRATLERVGVRSINNVVDVTNYVMLETGQPLHAFDYHLVAPGSGPESAAEPTQPPAPLPGRKPIIVIRRAKEGEKFTTLDGQERVLTNQMLLIADEQKGIALAGVMGGQNTEVNEQTKDVLIESACFQATNIRRTSKALGLRTDASFHFERGADIGMTDWASQRCAQLMLETAGGQLAQGVVDAYPQPAAPREIRLRFNKTNELLGVEIPVAQQIEFLCRLGLQVQGAAEGPAEYSKDPVPRQPGSPPEKIAFGIPTFRVDLKREIDLIEEIARLYGVEKIPATPPRGAIGANAFDAVYDEIAEARRLLTGLGLHEAQGQTLISAAAAKFIAVDPAALGVVELANPLSSDMTVLRPSLIPGLLDALSHNLHHQTGDVALFEIGRVFQHAISVPPPAGSRQEGGSASKEERRVAIALTGHRQPPFWSGEGRGAKFDIYDLKGLLEEFLEQFGLRGVTWSKRAESAPWFLESAFLQLGGRLTLGEAGQLSPLLARR